MVSGVVRVLDFGAGVGVGMWGRKVCRYGRKECNSGWQGEDYAERS